MEDSKSGNGSHLESMSGRIYVREAIEKLGWTMGIVGLCPQAPMAMRGRNSDNLPRKARQLHGSPEPRYEAQSIPVTKGTGTLSSTNRPPNSALVVPLLDA